MKEQYKSLLTDPHTTGQCLTSFQRKLLKQTLKGDIQPKYRQRIEIMLLADLGYSQSEICTELGCCQETARYWINIAKNGQAHQWNQTPIGRPKKTSENYQQRLKEIIRSSPREYGYSFSHWTAQWLSRHLAKEFGTEYSTRHIYRLLKKMGLSKKQRKLAATNHQSNSQSKIAIGHIKPVSEADQSTVLPSSVGTTVQESTSSQIFCLYPTN